jgi:hypothetical protein
MRNNQLLYIFVTLFIISSATAFGQEAGTDSSAKIYDLNDFKFRYQRYRALEFDYRMNGSINTNRFDESFSDFTTQSNSFNLNANLRGTSFENSERLQRIQSFQVIVSTMSRQNKVSNFPNTANSNSVNTSAQLPYLGYENTSRKYDGNKFLLLDYGGNFSVNTLNNPSTTNNITTQNKENQINLNAGIGVGFGRGRIENVSDAVTSYFILRDLQNNGVLQNFTASQLENLADGIVKTRNDRYIGDDRFRFVDQITRLDSVCKANGIVAANPVGLFTVLYDNFIFTSYFRETGRRHTFSLDARNNYSRSKSDNSNPFQIGSISVGPNYEYVNAFQKSMFLQRKTTFTAETGGVFYYLPNDEIKEFTNQYEPALQGFLNVSHGYIYQPNTRTFFDVSAFSNTSITNNKDIQNMSSNVGLQLDSNYFISRRFSLFLNANAFQNFRNDKLKNLSEPLTIKNRNFQFTFNSGLTYAFY